MQRVTNPTWDYSKLFLFVVLLAELVLLFSAIIFGRVLGYDLTISACFWPGVIVAGCFGVIILGSVLMIACIRLYQLIRKKAGLSE